MANEHTGLVARHGLVESEDVISEGFEIEWAVETGWGIAPKPGGDRVKARAGELRKKVHPGVGMVWEAMQTEHQRGVGGARLEVGKPTPRGIDILWVLEFCIGHGILDAREELCLPEVIESGRTRELVVQCFVLSPIGAMMANEGRHGL